MAKVKAPASSFSFGSLVPFPPAAESETLTEEQVYAQALAESQMELMQLLPIATVELSASEKQSVQIYQMSSLVLGPVARAAMICSPSCPDPIRNTCPLAAVDKAPFGKPCPFETQYITERFLGWMQEIGRTTKTLLETERTAIASLVALDLQEKRCNAALSEAQAAMMVSRSVRDVDTETGQPIAWEDVEHVNTVRLNEIMTQRRMILKDLELTPEAKTRRAKILNSIKAVRRGDEGSRASAKAEKIRQVQNDCVLEIELT